MTPELVARFWAKVHKGPACWEWTASRFREGYGAFWYSGKLVGAHRVAYLLAKGPIPPGLLVRHRCDNKRCVRPSHLLLGTDKDNYDDARERGQAPPPPEPFRGGTPPVRRGAGNGNARLSAPVVHLIRTSRESARSLARRLGVSHNTIAAVRRGETWRT